MKAVAFVASVLVIVLSNGECDRPMGEKMKFEVGGVTYSSHATPEEMSANRWKIGEKEKAGYSVVIISARAALYKRVDNIDDWALDELSLRRGSEDGLWYWSILFVHSKLGKDKEPDYALMGVHLDGTAFHITKE